MGEEAELRKRVVIATLRPQVCDLLNCGVRITQLVRFEQVQSAGGRAYVVQLKTMRRYLETLGDSRDFPQRSSGVLLENGRPLGPAHSVHDTIRQQGGGRFSHWGDQLVCSPYRSWASGAIGGLAAVLTLPLVLVLLRWVRKGSRPVVVAVTLCLATLYLLNYGVRITQLVRFEQVQSAGGRAYAVQLDPMREYLETLGDSRDFPQRSSGVLLEDGKQLGPAHSLHDTIRQRGGGRFSHWEDRLFFSAEDGSDPRENGRSYSFTSSYVLIKPYRAWANGAIGGLAVLLTLPIVLALVRRGVASTALRISTSCAWPFLPIALILSLTVAPITNVDSTVFTVLPMETALPLYPPLYLIFIHAVSATAEFVLWPFGGPPPVGGLLHPAPFTATVAMIVLLIQHGLCLLASAHLAARLRSDIAGARVITAVLYLNPINLLLTQSIYTEAITTPILYAAIAQALPIFRESTARFCQYSAFFLCVILAGLSRHPAIVIGFLPALGFAWASMTAAVRRSLKASKRLAKSSLLAATAAIGSYGAVVLITDLTMVISGVEVRSAVGRPFTNRFSFAITDADQKEVAEKTRVLARMPGYDRTSLQATVDRLVEIAPTEELKTVIMLATAGEPWLEPFKAIESLVLKSCQDCSRAHVEAEVDRRLNQVMMFAVLHPDTAFVQDVMLRLVQFIAPFIVQNDACPRLLCNGVEKFSMRVPPRKGFDQLAIRTGFIWEGAYLEEFFEGFISMTRNFTFLIAVVIVLGALTFRRDAVGEEFAVSLLLTAFLYAVLVSVVTMYVGRYGFFVDQLATVSMTSVLAGLNYSMPIAQGGFRSDAG